MASLITTTIRETITKTVASTSAAAATKAPPQGGILEHQDPSKYDPKNPVIIFIIQASIIIIFCRLLHYPLSLLRQPRVIAEVIGGILLGPSVFGRIPGFTNAIFPQAAMPNLSLVANLGLILFLFLVGLEVDVRFLTSNWRVALAVGIGGMALPFGLGCAIAWGIYNQFPSQNPISFGVFMLFVGVAMAITAFPVLCRILTELKLLNTPVGVIVLSAGVGNDVTGWILLALCVALVNAGTGLTALWVLLVSIGYVLVLVFAVRPAFLWLLKRTRSIQEGPSQGIVALTLLLVLASSFFTGVIGIHPIFGAFMIGVICPHEAGFAIKLTEKIEDLIGALFLPLYFALSGLSTNLGLLNSGIVWGYVIGILAVAFFGKVIGATLAARLTGMVWRESFAIGSLMSCKGLVELIVLNIGLNAKILSTQTFTMFVVMALITTFISTPMTHALYPPWYQRKLNAWKRGEIDWDTGKPLIETTPTTTTSSSVADDRLQGTRISKMLVHLSAGNMPHILAFMSILSPPRTSQVQVHPRAKLEESTATDNASWTEPEKPERSIVAHGVHLIGLTERPSSVMQVSEIDEYAAVDPVVHTFQTFGQLYHMSASGEVDVVPEDSFANTLTQRATDYSSDFIFLPWSEMGLLDVNSSKSSSIVEDSEYAKFIIRSLKKAPCNSAVFVNLSANVSNSNAQRGALHRSKSVQSLQSRGIRDPPKAPTTLSTGPRHIFAPLFGGPDDLLVIGLTLQLVQKGCTASMVRFNVAASIDLDDEDDEIDMIKSKSNTGKNELRTESTTVSDSQNISRTATNNTKLKKHATIQPLSRDTELFDGLQSTLAADILQRLTFDTIELDDPKSQDAATFCAERAAMEFSSLGKKVSGLVIVGRNWKLNGFGKRDGGDPEKCLGVVGMELVKANLKGGMLVVKAP